MCGSSKSEQTTNFNNQSGPEDWVRNAGKEIFSNAAGIINDNGIPVYNGPRVADYGDDFDAARGTVYGLANNTGAMDASRMTLDNLSAAVNPDLGKTVGDWMNPYTEGVLSPTLRKISEAAQNQRLGLNAQATMAGAFGDSSWGQQQGQVNRDEQTAWADAANRAYSDAFTNALSQMNTVRGQAAGLSGAYNAQQENEATFGSTLAQLFAGLADKQRSVDQAGLDASREALYESQDRPLNQLAALNSMLSGTPQMTLSSGTQTSETEQPDNGGWGLLGSVLGAGLKMLPAFSDARLKKDISYTGGIDLWTGAPSANWRYLWDADDAPLRTGPLAQDVEKTRPEAVIQGPGGWKMLDLVRLAA